MGNITNDSAISLAQKALNGLSYRKDLIAQNIANVDTPGYLAKEVNFETAIKHVMSGNDSIQQKKTREGHMSPNEISGSNFYNVRNRPGGSLRNDGNDVDIDQELVEMSETELKYQALTQVITKKLSILKSIST
ncbi:MAG: flagellar basal body rod protein FlgB [Anaerolineaceae bacterium]|nr:flagellar basal body rod protein FlgB [Anaerolineaceae bacterium]